jgi:uncharacterized protein
MPQTLSRCIAASALLLAPLAFSSIAYGSSFDCSGAVSPSEKAICADPYTSKLDQKLGELWRLALPKVADPKAFKSDQRQWLKQRNQCADQLDCLRRQYVGRITVLEHVATPFSWDATWQRVPWDVSTGASLTTKPKDATHITFEMAAASGANSGNLDGIATLDGDTAHYVENACTLTFKAVNGLLDVDQNGDDAECGAGMGVFYAGRYIASEQSLELDYDLLSLGLVHTQQENEALRTLLKDDYQRLVDSSSSRTLGDTSPDVPSADVDDLWVRGIADTHAAIFMHTSNAQFWLVLLVTEQPGHTRARYYTNVPSWKGRLPDSLKRWYNARAADKPLDLMP